MSGSARGRRWLTGGLVVAAVAVATIATGIEAVGQADTDPGDLQAIIDEADDGSTIVLDGATYDGGVTIDKPLTLRGEDWPVIDGGGEGTVITVTATDVTLEGLVIRGSGSNLDHEDSGVSSDDSHRIHVIDNRFEDVLFGAFLRGSDEVVVSGNDISSKDLFIARRGDGLRLWESHDSLVENNVIQGARDSVFWFCDRLTVRDNVVADGRYGLHFMYSDDSVVERNVLRDNSVGGFLMYSLRLTVTDNVLQANRGPSGYGLGLKDMDGVTATGNRFVGNRVGLYLDNSPSAAGVEQHWENNVFAFNDTGVLIRPSVKNNVFWDNAFIDNVEQVAIDGSGTIEENVWAVDGRGNHWSDFAGYDADGDGIGDVAYHVDDLFSDLTDRYPSLSFFQATPAAQTVDMAARAFPDLRPQPKVTDDSPLTGMPSFPAMPATADEGPSTLSVALASLLLLAIAGALIGLAHPTARFHRKTSASS